MTIADQFRNTMRGAENAFHRGKSGEGDPAGNIPHGDTTFPSWNPFGNKQKRGGRD